jgi:hypothetical protein
MGWFTDTVLPAFKDKDGTWSWTKIAAATGATVAGLKLLSDSELGAKIGDFMGIGGNQQPVGYQGKIPDYTGIRSVVGDTYDPLRRPGSGGQRYFSDMAFATPGVAADASKGITTAIPGNVQELMNAADAQATASKALNRDNRARQLRPQMQRTPEEIAAKYNFIQNQTPYFSQDQKNQQVQAAMNKNGISPFMLAEATGLPAANIQQKAREYTGLAPRIPAAAPTNNINKTLQDLIAASQPRAYGTGQMPPAPPPTMQMAQGGLASLTNGMYLGGPTDGMADEIPASIDGNQAAALSDGEFVLPADVVSHLGNGNSEAGAQILYSMMERIRKARTGTTAQGKQINPGKMLPQ